MIFAAGLGTRLKPLTDTTPKALLPLAGKTLLQWQIDKLKAAGITDIVVNVHHFADQIINYLQQHNNFGCHVLISDERQALLETGGGLRKAQTLLLPPNTPLDHNQPILVCNVDILSNIDLRAFINAYQRTDLGLLVVSQRNTQRYLLFDNNNILRGWTNIATGEIRPDTLPHDQAHTLAQFAFSGMQILSPRIFERMDKIVQDKGDKFSLIDLYLTLTETETIRAYIPEQYRMMDVGKISQLADAEDFAESLI